MSYPTINQLRHWYTARHWHIIAPTNSPTTMNEMARIGVENGTHIIPKVALYCTPTDKKKRGMPRTTWRRTITSEHWQEKRRQIKNNMQEDNNIRALAREKEADQEQHAGGQ